MILLLLAACLPTTDDSAATDRPARDGDTTGDTEETTRGSTVRLVVNELTGLSYGSEPTVEPPENGTFLRVDTCTADTPDGSVVCEPIDGGWYLYEDGSVTITPNTWDGDIARVTWLVIE